MASCTRTEEIIFKVDIIIENGSIDIILFRVFV